MTALVQGFSYSTPPRSWTFDFVRVSHTQNPNASDFYSCYEFGTR